MHNALFNQNFQENCNKVCVFGPQATTSNQRVPHNRQNESKLYIKAAKWFLNKLFIASVNGRLRNYPS